MEKKEGEEIDLGLSELIGGFAPSEILETPAPIVEKIEAEPSAEPKEKSTFQVLADEELWTKIIEITEKRLNLPDQEGIEATLWWVRASLISETIPAGILAAPLEGAARKIWKLKDGNQLFNLALESTKEMLTYLDASSDKVIFDSIDALNEDLRRALSLPTEKVVAVLPSWEAEENLTQTINTVTPKKNNFRNALIALSFFVFVLASWLLYVEEKDIVTAVPNIQDELLKVSLAINEKQDLKLIPPTLELKQTASQLDAVYYEIDKKSPEKTQDNNDGLAPLVTKEKAEVDFSGPFEDELPPARRERPQVSVVNRTNQQQSSEPERSPFGDEIKAKVPDSEILFEAINQTEVHEEPNFRSKIVAVLYQGDVVAVDRELGDWVRVRSQRGRPGYVLSGDLRESYKRR